MSKAILIIDMPKSCYECKLQVHNMVGDHICVINHKTQIIALQEVHGVR